MRNLKFLVRRKGTLNLTIHPEAAKNCNNKAEDLLKRLQPAPERFTPKPKRSNPNIHSTHTFTRENIIGEMGFGWSDSRGNTVAKAFEEGNELVCLRMIMSNSGYEDQATRRR